MDGHVEVAKLLLDCGAQVCDNNWTPMFCRGVKLSSASSSCSRRSVITNRKKCMNLELMMDPDNLYRNQVNMPVDSFESPLTLAACGGHVELAQLLIDRGANIEEVSAPMTFYLLICVYSLRNPRIPNPPLNTESTA